MSYADRLNKEIEDLVTLYENNGDPINALWMAEELVRKHRHILGDGNGDLEFWLWCGYETVRARCRKYLAKRLGETPENAASQTDWLPGFERIQKYYPVTRQDEEFFVTPYDLTDDEIDEKVEAYEAMGSGIFAHADELRRFKIERAAIA